MYGDGSTSDPYLIFPTQRVRGGDNAVGAGKVVELPEHEPIPWDGDAELHIVGQRATRVDAPEKVAGHARYTADLTRPGLLYAAILRSSIARGRVTLDLAPARRSAAVVLVVALLLTLACAVRLW